ncbi:MAG: hypothetical protein ACRDHE_13425 [Ktedonobacterales bacterium]
MSDRATPADDDQLEREQRVRTLRDLAAVATPVERPEARPALADAEVDDSPPSDAAIQRAPLVTAADGFAALEDWSSPARRVLWIVTLVAVVAALALYGALSSGALRVGGGAAHVAGSPKAAGAAGPTVIPLARDNIDCVADMTWSPDSASVAVLGYSAPGQCNGVGYLNVYNTTSKRLTAQVTLDTVVLRALAGVNPNTNLNPSLNYQRVLWSGAGHGLAVTFTIYTFLDAPNTNVSLAYSGLVLLDNTGGHIGVLLQPYAANNAVATRWDLYTGKATILPAPTTTSGGSTYSYTSLAPALWYDWTPASLLVPSIPLSPVTAPPASPLTEASASIGSPVSDAQFSVWQPGVAALDVSSVNGQQTALIPGAYTWNAAFATWSPDGRYIVDPVSLTARIQVSGAKQPSQSSLQQMGLDAAPLVPLRDAGLGAVLLNMPKDIYAPASQRVLLAWNSDARVLASYPSSYLVPVSVNGRSAPLTIYDTATGSVLRMLTPPRQGSPTFLRVDGALRWSPDSRQLALYDPGLARLLIWDTSAFAG